LPREVPVTFFVFTHAERTQIIGQNYAYTTSL